MEELEPRGAPLEKLSRSQSRRVLSCLTEATFFYRQDDPDLFDYLRRHRADFARFFEEHFGWALYVDKKCARLFRRAQENPALTPKQRDLFDLTRREECILFMLLLEFHELELAAQNVHPEHDDDLRFVLADFVAHAVKRYRELLGERAPSDRELLEHARRLFGELERHRFLRLCERGDGETAPEQLLYEVLPGLRCYDPTALSPELVRRAHGVAEQPAAVEVAEEAELAPDATASGGEEGAP